MRENKIIRFVRAIPYFLEFKEPEPASYMLELLYLDEIKNKKSFFASSDEFRLNDNRYDFLYNFICADKDKLEYTINLLKVIDYTKHLKRGGCVVTNYNKAINKTKKGADKYPDIDSFMTRAEAVESKEKKRGHFWFS